MSHYNSNAPANYDQIRSLGDQVSNTIKARKIPQPEYMAKVLGEGAINSYYLMHALLYAIEHHRGRGIPDYKRRDKKAIQRHSYDSAFRPFYRFKDSEMPSGYLLTPREINGVLVHDLGEEFGKNLFGALVVNNVIKQLLGAETGTDADLLTDRNALLLSPLEDEIAKLDESQINHKNVYNAFEKLESRVKVGSPTVSREYKKVLDALKSFRTYADNHVNYMPESQKRVLLRIYDDLISSVKGIIKSGVLTAEELAGEIKKQYRHVISIMDSGNYLDVDRRLVLPGESEFFITLKRTLYKDNSKRIADAVKSAAISKEGTPADNYEAPFMAKDAESTDTVANMDNILQHAISIVGKGQISTETGIYLVGDSKQNGSGFQMERVQTVTVYLFRNIQNSIDDRLLYLKKRAKRETTTKEDVNVFMTLKEKIEELGERVDEMEGQGWIMGLLHRAHLL